MATDLQSITAKGNGVELWPANAPATEYDQLKGQFLASLNHELRTPLSGVIGMTELLLETTLDEEQLEYVQTVRECAAQLLETLNSVLDYSSLSAGNFRLEDSEFLLPSLLESAASDADSKARAKGLRFVRDWDPSLPETAIGDERHIRQILGQLLRNAVKFTSEGEVTLRARHEPLSGARFRLLIEVSDTGIGIPPEKLRLIFESFRQLDSGLARSFTGLGLGLAITERIVHIMHGEITVDSAPNKGSRFSIKLPLRAPSAATEAESTGNPPAPLDAVRRVLVVEDNKIAQQVIGHVLQKEFFHVSFADNGEQGIALASRNSYDLILMDLQMPGIDGLEATHHIRALPGYDKTPILALSANYSDEHRQLCHQIGMQGFLSKPIQKEELIATLRQFLG